MTNKQKEAGSDPGLLLLYFRHRPRRRTISTPRLVDSIFHRGDYWMPAFAGMTTQEFCHAHDVSLRPGIVGSSAAAGFGARRAAGLAPRHACESAFRDPRAEI